MARGALQMPLDAASEKWISQSHLCDADLSAENCALSIPACDYVSSTALVNTRTRRAFTVGQPVGSVQQLHEKAKEFNNIVSQLYLLEVRICVHVLSAR